MANSGLDASHSNWITFATHTIHEYDSEYHSPTIDRIPESKPKYHYSKVQLSLFGDSILRSRIGYRPYPTNSNTALQWFVYRIWIESCSRLEFGFDFQTIRTPLHFSCYGLSVACVWHLQITRNLWKTNRHFILVFHVIMGNFSSIELLRICGLWWMSQELRLSLWVIFF